MRKVVAILCTLCALGAAAATSKATKKPAKKIPATKPIPFTPTKGLAIKHSPSEHRKGPKSIYPDVHENPGAIDPAITQDNIADNICNKAFKTETIRPPSSYTNKVKKQQMAEIYGFTVKQDAKLIGDDELKCKPRSNALRCYEEDHIISLQNGGAPSDPDNLYPEAYNTSVKGDHVGAHEKDKVENFVHNGICLGLPNAKFSSGPKPTKRLTLEEGQHILAIDWYRCYQSMADGKDCNPP